MSPRKGVMTGAWSWWRRFAYALRPPVMAYPLELAARETPSTPAPALDNLLDRSRAAHAEWAAERGDKTRPHTIARTQILTTDGFGGANLRHFDESGAPLGEKAMTRSQCVALARDLLEIAG